MLDRSFLTGDIANKVVVGENVVIFTIDFYESEHVYFVLSDVTPEKNRSKIVFLTIRNSKVFTFAEISRLRMTS